MHLGSTHICITTVKEKVVMNLKESKGGWEGLEGAMGGDVIIL